MVQNYIVTAWRNIRRNGVYAFINIFGLAVGLACTIAIALYILDEYSYDRFHSHEGEIYRIVEIQDHDGTLHPVAATPGPLAKKLEHDYTEIAETCRVGRPRAGILATNNAGIEPTKIVVADKAFFTLFDFKLLKGSAPEVLLQANELVITASVARQLFGDGWERNSKVIGHPVRLNNMHDMVIAGVSEDCPKNSHIQFDIVVSTQHEELHNPNNVLNWHNHIYHTYIRLAPGTDAAIFGEKIRDDMDGLDLWANPVLLLQRLTEIYLHSRFDYGDWVKTGSLEYLRIFMAVGVVILVIALFNFINLSTARATQRAKEVGVRKVIGALRQQLVLQFLCESLIMTLVAISLSFLLLQMFVPVLNEMSGKSLSIPFTNAWFAASVFVLATSIGFLAGIYPAAQLSGFQPLRVMKGFFKTGSGLFFRRSLVVAQFTLSVALVAGTIVISRQLAFVQRKNLGFDKEQLLFLQMKNEIFSRSALLKADLQAQTSISNVTRTSHNLIDMTGSTHGVKWEGQSEGHTFSLCHMNVDADFLATTGIALAAGRNFDPGAGSDSTSWLINEMAAKQMGWTSNEAVGKMVQLWDTRGTVVGVVKDFHFRPLTTPIEPMLFHYWPGDRYAYQGFFIRTRPDKAQAALEVIERLYRKHDPQTTPQYDFVDQTIQNKYGTEKKTGRLVLYFATLAILISCLGLFGLTTFAADQRAREIGIRKIVGASVRDIVRLLSKEFVGLVVLAIFIASPLAWWVMSHWLEGFVYRIELEWWMMPLSGAAAIAIALVTVLLQSVRAGMMNPLNSLHSE